jgi:hypothetical protein
MFKWPKGDYVIYQGQRFDFEQEMTLRPDETWKVYARIVRGRPTIIERERFEPFEPLEDVNIKYLLGVDQAGEFQLMPACIMRGQKVRAVARTNAYGQELTPPVYRMIMT